MKTEPKKVLILTYYWPPAGGPGVQRWLKFVKYLPDFNIQPYVYIPKNPTYPIIDENLIKEISPKAFIIRKNIFEPYGFASLFSKNKTKQISSGIIPNKKKQSTLDKIFLWIRGNLFIPDARVFWVKPSTRFLEKYIKENQIDTIITTGPPHSLHLIGLNLKNKLNIKWIADFRDPWTSIGYHKALKLTDSSANKHMDLEEEVLNTADTIIVTSKNTKMEFESLTDKPIVVITNGYDFENVEKQPLDAKFSIAHIGSLLSKRNPRILWEVLSELIHEIPEFAAQFELKLIGTVSQEILDTIHNYNLDAYLNYMGYVSHQEAIIQQQKSQVLLLIEINSLETTSIIPGKLFEYIISERPIVAIGPANSDFAEIIKETNSGFFFDYTQKESLKKTILDYFEKYKTGNLKSNPTGIEKYSRKNLTETLSHLILNN